MEIRAFTETAGDATIRYQVGALRDSALVWAQVCGGGAAEADGMGGGDAGAPATSAPQLGRLAVALPGAQGDDGLPAAATVVGGRAGGLLSERVASRLARRLGVAVYASVELGEMGGVVSERVVLRLADELRALGFTGGAST